jgi:hypothetical protein
VAYYKEKYQNSNEEAENTTKPSIRLAHLASEIRISDLTDTNKITSHYTVTLDTGSTRYTEQKHPLPTPGPEPRQSRH